MEKELTHTSTDTDYSSHLPLESIILYLKSNGFSIKPDDYIEILKVIERFRPATLKEAGNLICPLISTSDEEQARFYIVFKKLCEAEETTPPPSRPWWKKNSDWLKSFSKKKKRKFLLIGILLLIAISVIIIILIIPPSPKNQIKAEITTSYVENGTGFQIGDPVTLDSYSGFLDNPKAINHVKIDWDTGNGWQYHNQDHISFVPSHTGTQAVMLRIISGGKHVSIDTAFINVCEKFPLVTINSDPRDSLTITRMIQIDATVAPNKFKNISYAWVADEDTVKRNTTTLNHRFEKAGDHTIYFVIILNENNTEFSRSFPKNFTVVDPDAKQFKLLASQVGDVINPPKKIKNWLQGLVFYLFIVPFILSLLLRWILKRRKRKEKKIINSVFDTSATGTADKKPLFEIPLENRQQQLIASEPVMNNVMQFMLQRTMDESLALNIHQTVQHTIRSGGIPELVYRNQLRHNDYLILIDSSINNSQQLKLFEYLVKTFRSENISIVRFFYQDNFSKFYNEEYPSGFPLKRLAELYKDYTLLVFGAAHHLVYDAYPVIETERLSELSDWENKAILTPVPFTDWGIKEKLIGEQIILLPADAEGQLRLIKGINEKLLNHRDYLSSVKSFYSAGKYDFTEPDDIKTYLGDEDLYQWICSLAIYPKIRWEVLIELGKAVLESRGCPEKINYSNLLKLVRISWLREGYFPEDTRLELLKQLGVQEEIVARKKLVELFQYADLYFKDSYFFSNEKKVQEVTNKFILYANDPVNNESYTSSKKQFEALLNQNRITDAPLKEYIDNSKKEPWETPIKNKEGTTVGSDEYFVREGALVKPSKLAKWSGVFSEIAGVCFLLLIGISQFGNSFAKTGIAKFLGIRTTDSSRLVPVTVDISPFGKCMNSAQDSTRLRNVTFSVYDNQDKPLEPYETTSTKYPDSNDSSTFSQLFNIPYRSLFAGSLTLKINWALMESAGKSGVELTIKKRTLNILQQQYVAEQRINPLSPKALDLQKKINVLKKDITLLTLINNQINDTIYHDKHSQTAEVSITTNKIITTIDACLPPTPNKALIADAGPDMLITLPANTVTFSGSGISPDGIITFYSWIKISGPAAGTLTNSNKQSAKVSGLVEGVYSYQLKVTDNRGASGMDTVNISVNTGTCNPIPITQLPSSLTEIWKGVSIPQLITIDIRNKKIWLSKGDKKIFDTYNIVDACLSNTGVYKVIGQTNNRFKVFFIKNVQSNQFVLSVCDGLQTSKELAMQVEEASCNNYHRMNIYNNEPDFPVPADVEKNVFFFSFQQKDQMLPSEYRRLNNKLAAALTAGKRGETASLINSFFTPKNVAGALEQQQFITTKKNLPSSFFGPENDTIAVLDNSSKSMTFDGTPFDRDCLLVGLGARKVLPDPCEKIYTSISEIQKNSPSVKICRVNLSQQNLSKIPAELYLLKDLKDLDIRYNYIPVSDLSNFKKIVPNCNVLYVPQLAGPPNPDGKVKNGTIKIEFASDTSSLDAKTNALLINIANVLEKQPDASIELTAYYYSSKTSGITIKRLSSIINKLNNFGKHNTAQVQKKTQQIIKPLNLKDQPINYIDISYTNFPVDFSPK